MTRALHRLLRRLLPSELRRLHGADMEETFVEALAEARGDGLLARLRLWGRELVDLAVTGRALRIEGRRHGADFVVRGARRGGARRAGGGVTGISDDVRYAIRSLVRRPTLSLFAVLTTGLGVGATTAMFNTIDGVVLRPLPYERGDRMVGLFRRLSNMTSFVTPLPESVEVWAGQTDVFEAVEPWTARSMTLTGRGEPRELSAALIRPSYHDLIGRDPLVGRRFDEAEMSGEGASVVLMSYPLGVSLFGTAAAALGQTLSLNGDTWTVVGVMPPGTLLPGWGLRSVDLWRPLASDLARSPAPAIGVLREGVTVDQANERLQALEEPADGTSTGYASLVRDQVSAGLRGHLRLLMGAVVLLLLISCVNVSNLLLFRADARRRETAVRTALGGGRGRLARQHLVESLVLALAGGAVGILVAYAGQAAMLRLRPGQLEVLDIVSIDGRAFLFALTVALLSGVLFGLIPALQAGRAGAHDVLRSGVRIEGDPVGRRVRWVLVVGEVALSFALLIGSFTVMETLLERQGVEFGYAVDDIVAAHIRLPAWRYETEGSRTPVYESIVRDLHRLPGAVAVTRASSAPPRVEVLFGNVEVEGRAPTEEVQVLHGPFVRDDYFSTVGQRVIQGRGFTREDLASEEPLIILSEATAAAFFPDGQAVGSRLRVGLEEDDAWTTVVVVTADVPMTGLSTRREVLQVYHPLRAPGREATFIVRLREGTDHASTMASLRRIVTSPDPEIGVEWIAGGRELQRETLESERFVTTVMAAFATFALLLAALGLYGVVSQVVGRRTREIGIRIALGASRGSVAGMVLGRAGGAVAAGIAVGVLLALGGSGVLERWIVDVATNDGRMYAPAAALLLLTALVAAYVPARRAARVDPVEAMRVE